MALKNPHHQQSSFSGMIFALISVINVKKQMPNISHQEMMLDMQVLGDYRKRWYQRAMDQWKTLSNTHATPTKTAKTNSKLWKNNIINAAATNNNNDGKLRKCSSLSMATASFTRVCLLCAPISSYSEVFRSDHPYVPSRRSNSYPRSKQIPATTATTNPQGMMMMMMINPNNLPARVSTEGRKVFRGKSLTDDVLMRRFVVEEEAMMQVRRKDQMEVIRRRILMRRKKLGPSPLSRMALVEEEEEEMLHFY